MSLVKRLIEESIEMRSGWVTELQMDNDQHMAVIKANEDLIQQFLQEKTELEEELRSMPEQLELPLTAATLEG